MSIKWSHRCCDNCANQSALNPRFCSKGRAPTYASCANGVCIYFNWYGPGPNGGPEWRVCKS